MSGPAYHGRTHTADGTDPIPGMGTGDGIEFDVLNGNDTPPNHWLFVTTTDVLPSTSYGMHLTDSAGGIKLASTGLIDATAGSNMNLRGVNSVGITSDGSISVQADLDFNVTTGDDVLMTVAGDLTLDGAGLMTVTSTLDAIFGSVNADVTMSFASGHSFTVETAALSPPAAFRIDSDGSIHGKSSIGVITWDLP